MMKAAVLFSTAAYLIATPVLAQQTSPAPTGSEPPAATVSTSAPDAVPAQAADQAQDGTGVQDIVVTAQRRAENLQRVPIAITAVSGSELASRGIDNSLQLNTVAPGLNVRTTAGSFQPSIRGIGTSSNVVENPVALYIDGVYLPQQREGLRQLKDVAQVAVLKGPQGTLFGRNATGGVIQITTLAPSHEASGKIDAEIDNYATLKVGGYVTGGLSDQVAASLSMSFAKQGDGWGDNLTTGRDTFKLLHSFEARGKLLIEPGAGTSATIILDYMNRRELANTYQGYRDLPFIVPGALPLRNVYDTYGGIDSYNAFEGGGASLTVDHELSFAKLTSITSYRRGKGQYRFTVTPVPNPAFIAFSPNSPIEYYTLELQLSSKDNKVLSWTVGAFYYHNTLGAEPIIRNLSGPYAPLATSAAVTNTRSTEITESVAPFAQASLTILPRTRLTGGIRYSYEKRKLVDSSIVSTLNNGTTTTLNIPNKDLTIKKPTFRVALDHDFTSDILGYASFNTGFKSGGFNTVSPTNPAYLPEKLSAYEAGFKAQLFDRRLRLNGAGFYYDYTNLQVIQLIGVAQTVVNGPKARLYGLDLDFEARLAADLRVSGGLEWLHAKFVSYPGAIFSTPRPTGGAVIFAGDASGNRLPLAQRFTATTSVDYHHELSEGSLDFNVTGNYNGDYYFEADNFLRQSPYVILNSSLRYNLPDSRIGVTVFGRNLFDRHVITQTSTQSGGYPTTYGMPPRTVGIRLDVAL